MSKLYIIQDVIYIYKKSYILFRMLYIFIESHTRYQKVIYIIQNIIKTKKLYILFKISYIFIKNHITYQKVIILFFLCSTKGRIFSSLKMRERKCWLAFSIYPIIKYATWSNVIG